MKTNNQKFYNCMWYSAIYNIFFPFPVDRIYFNLRGITMQCRFSMSLWATEFSGDYPIILT